MGMTTEDLASAQRDGARQVRPRRHQGLETYDIGGEMVVLPRDGERVYALNESGKQIFGLCDGRHTLEEMVAALHSRFEASDAVLMADVSAAVFDLQELGLVHVPPRPENATSIAPAAGVKTRPDVRFVFGVEDRSYFHWQLAILFESLVGQLPDGWDVTVVVCNDDAPISDDLAKIVETYGARALTGTSLGDRHNIDFAAGGERYVPMNRVEALSVMRQVVQPDDVVCLMDTDVFLYGDLQEQLFPTGNAMARNWIVSEERYFSFSTEGERGVSLPRLLEALGCSQEFKPGGVTVFLTGETLQRDRVVPDIFRFLQVLYLLGKVIDAPDHGVWVSEMACFALAMYPNGIDYELLDVPQFAVQEQGAEAVPEGSFYHYYADINDGNGGPFFGSEWHKQLFRDSNMLLRDFDSFLQGAKGPLERRFFELADRARRRLYGIKRDTE
jgi:Coenzyme PQQ synthesis protein D (PqqD)